MFEEKSKLPHRSMNKLLLRKYKDINVKLLHKIANGFNLSIYQFIDDELFDMSNIEYKDNKNKIRIKKLPITATFVFWFLLF